MAPEFEKFPKIPRLRRNMVVTEKIDGTNAQIYIDEDGVVFAGSRNRWVLPDDDNFGFAKWVHTYATELVSALGPGRHYGEWWGSGIQRGYGLDHKRFSLFNTSRWLDDDREYVPQIAELGEIGLGVVPLLDVHTFDMARIQTALDDLNDSGSKAAPGFLNPEGVVIYVQAAGALFKQTIEGDEMSKSEAKRLEEMLRVDV